MSTAVATDDDLLLLTVADVMRRCQIGKLAALELIHSAGPVRLGRSLRVRPADLDAEFSRRRVRQLNTKEES
ncbi:MAG: hypothetical protein WCC30_06750 [Candidatus Dormiibacterota bacterium]